MVSVRLRCLMTTMTAMTACCFAYKTLVADRNFATTKGRLVGDHRNETSAMVLHQDDERLPPKMTTPIAHNVSVRHSHGLPMFGLNPCIAHDGEWLFYGIRFSPHSIVVYHIPRRPPRHS